MKRKILVLGDSHAFVFKSRFMRFFDKKNDFITYQVVGATVSGLDNPNSKTNALEIFNIAVSNNKDVQTAIVLIGEVDTGFVIWYRAEKYNESVNSMLLKAVENYKRYLIKLKLSFNKIIVLSAPLPTIKDNQEYGDVANQRKEIRTTQIERTLLTIKFNSLIEAFCINNGIKSINLDTISKNRNGYVKWYLRHYKSSNHHYNNLVYSFIIYRRLKKVLAVN